MRRMINSIRYKKILILGLFCSLIAGATNPVFSYTFSFLLEGIVPSPAGEMGSSSYLRKWSCIVLGVAAADGIFNFAKGFLLGYCSEYWIMAVSYTHLDVYKRQFSRIPPIAVECKRLLRSCQYQRHQCCFPWNFWARD